MKMTKHVKYPLWEKFKSPTAGIFIAIYYSVMMHSPAADAA